MSRKIFRHSVVLALLAIHLTQAHALCDRDEQQLAAAIDQKIENWAQLRKLQMKIGACDQGSIAEGITEAVVNLLANHWDKLDQLARYSGKQKSFGVFVIRHITATADDQQLLAIIGNAEKYCPDGHLRLCANLAGKAKIALKESSELDTESTVGEKNTKPIPKTQN